LLIVIQLISVPVHFGVNAKKTRKRKGKEDGKCTPPLLLFISPSPSLFLIPSFKDLPNKHQTDILSKETKTERTKAKQSKAKRKKKKQTQKKKKKLTLLLQGIDCLLLLKVFLQERKKAIGEQARSEGTKREKNL